MGHLTYTARLLFGGAIHVLLPSTFADSSAIRQVPDNQEVWLDADGFTSVVIEIMEQVEEGTDEAAFETHLQDLVAEDRSRVTVWRREQVQIDHLAPETPAYTLLATTPPGAKQVGRANEPDFIGIILLLIRLKQQKTDILISVNVPHVANQYSKDDLNLANGQIGPLFEQGLEIHQKLVRSFEIKDWSLFGEE